MAGNPTDPIQPGPAVPRIAAQPEPAAPVAPVQADAAPAPPYYPPPVYSQPPVGYYGAPPPAQQAYGYYQPPYPQPGYAPAAYGYPGYPSAPQAPQQDHSLSMFAGVMWLFLMLRDIFVAVGIALLGTFLGIFSIPLGFSIAMLVVFPIISMVGCMVAMYADFSHKHWAVGAVGGGVALGASLFPGLFGGFGIAGAIIGGLAMVLHLVAHKEFAAPAA